MKIFSFLFSGKFMGILMVIFAISIGYATFIENDFDSKTAKLLIYNAWWFEAILVLMIINFSGMIYTKRLYRKSKLNILVMHMAFIIIIIGAGITRYLGFEGQMHIRNGQTTNKIRSYDDYVNVVIKDKDHNTRIYDKIILAPINKNLYSKSVKLNKKNIKLEIEGFRPNMQKVLQQSPDGFTYLHLMTVSRHGREELFLREYEKDIVEGVVISFGDTLDTEAVQFYLEDSVLMFRAPLPAQPMHMGSQSLEILEAHVFHQVKPRQLYKIGDVSFVLGEVVDKAIISYMPAHEGSAGGLNLIDLKVSIDDVTRDFMIKQGAFEQVIVDDIQFTMNIGSQIYTIPFELKLNKFELDRYPGSQSPSSFASDIVVIDQKLNVEQPYRIFMNNVLDYKGYRFYQSSYDSDEKGTILSVNRDYWGTIVTYIGYFLLFFSLILSLFTKNTRFAKLTKQMNEVHAQRKTLTLSLAAVLMIAGFTGNGFAQSRIGEIDKDFATAFGRIMVQSKDGRIIPLNTIATNSLVKIYKKAKFDDLNADQVFIEMLIFPEKWKGTPMIKIYEAEVQEMVGIDNNFAAYNDFFDDRGKYKLKEMVDEIYAKSPALRSKIDKEIINVDERLNVSNMVYNGSLLKIYPIPDDPNNTWVSPAIIRLKNADSTATRRTYMDLIANAINQGLVSGNYMEAEGILSEIRDLQLEHGKDILPSRSSINMEILYNKVNIFKRLFPIYMMLGMLLLGIFLLQLFKPSFEFAKLIKVIYIALWVGFILQTLGLALRWYVSGHAPWSNGYESMIYIAWAAMLAGFVFYRKSPITLSVTTILSGITLLTAHMSWLNPEITNLVPVLKSYWLTIHVATITASYGFFGLASMMGILNLCIMIFRNKVNHERINLKLKELTIIIEMSLMVGLILMVIGNFLGGIWANESWGRYWGWDPKETWSLVTIIVYSFILHMRLIPGMRNLFSINFMAHIGFGSVLMTYFGVNYYLSGLHSYAQGDPVPLPTFVYYMVAAITIISVLAVVNDINLKNKLEVQGELDDDE
jgi:cytochrome c-type biogenesis protein CcsB